MKTKKIFILPTILEGKGKIVELLGVMGTNETGNKCKICGEAMGNNVITPRLSKYVLSSSHFIYNGTAQHPKIVVKDEYGDTVSSQYYDVVYSRDCQNISLYIPAISYKCLFFCTFKICLGCANLYISTIFFTDWYKIGT